MYERDKPLQDGRDRVQSPEHDGVHGERYNAATQLELAMGAYVASPQKVCREWLLHWGRPQREIQRFSSGISARLDLDLPLDFRQRLTVAFVVADYPLSNVISSG